MIQRVQSLCIATLCVAMVVFFISGVGPFLVLRASVDLPLFKALYKLGPYVLACLLAVVVLIIAVYTILQHDNRKVQLHYTAIINLLLVLLMGLVLYGMRQIELFRLSGNMLSYKLLLLTLAGWLANTMARYYIRKDEALVNENSLR